MLSLRDLSVFTADINKVVEYVALPFQICFGLGYHYIIGVPYTAMHYFILQRFRGRNLSIIVQSLSCGFYRHSDYVF